MMPDVDVDAAIRNARQRLDAFERRASARDLLVRLRAHSPFHLALMARTFGLLGTALLLVLSVAALGAPFVSEDLAEIIARLDAAAPVEAPLFAYLALLVILSFVVGLGGHYGALAAARSAPLLAHEAKVHQRLVSDLQQLEAQRALQARLTPISAEPRGRRR